MKLAFVASSLVVVTVGCGSSPSAGYALDVGGDDAAATRFIGADGGAGQGLDAYVEQGQVAVKVITLSCAGDCATVQAIGTGGSPPYSYAWEDGTTNPVRQLCPASDSAYSVQVTDTGETGEVPRPAQTAHTSVSANVLGCFDAGATCGDVVRENVTPAPPPTCTTDGGASSAALGITSLALPFPIDAGESYELSFALVGTQTDFLPYTIYGETDSCAVSDMLGTISLQGSNAQGSLCLHPGQTFANIGLSVGLATGNVTGATITLCKGCESGM
jgi:hypothetical protein